MNRFTVLLVVRQHGNVDQLAEKIAATIHNYSMDVESIQIDELVSVEPDAYGGPARGEDEKSVADDVAGLRSEIEEIKRAASERDLAVALLESCVKQLGRDVEDYRKESNVTRGGLADVQREHGIIMRAQADLKSSLDRIERKFAKIGDAANGHNI